jgi:hypothetical protein
VARLQLANVVKVGGKYVEMTTEAQSLEVRGPAMSYDLDKCEEVSPLLPLWIECFAPLIYWFLRPAFSW